MNEAVEYCYFQTAVAVRVGFVIPVGRHFAGPPSHMRHPNSRSATQTNSHPGLPRVGARRYRLVSSAPYGLQVASSAKSWLGSSSQDTVEQEPGKEQDGVDAGNAVDLEARPFPKVGDVVRFEGKWKNDVSFGEVNDPAPFAPFRLGFREYPGLRCIDRQHTYTTYIDKTWMSSRKYW